MGKKRPILALRNYAMAPNECCQKLYLNNSIVYRVRLGVKPEGVRTRSLNKPDGVSQNQGVD